MTRLRSKQKTKKAMTKNKSRKSLSANYSKNSKGKKRIKSSKFMMVMFALIFAVSGVYLLLNSLASTATLTSIEAETMSLEPTAAIIVDSTASGGKAVRMDKPGSASGSFSLSSPATNIVVRSKAGLCSGSPRLSVIVDGIQVHSNSMSATSWTDISIAKPLIVGQHTLNVSFTEDFDSYKGNKLKCSRSLYLDKIYALGDVAPPPPPPPAASKVYGTLQSSTSRISTNKDAGVNLVTLSIHWDRFEPAEGQLDTAYIASIKDQISQYRNAGMQIILGTGIHHPPSWLFNYPYSRYIDQYGDVYAPGLSGKNIANMIFNQNMRDKQETYLNRVFTQLGTDFYAVRLGGGWYGELNYPDNNYNNHSNAYWAYDQIAQGNATGLPSSMTKAPITGWRPGSTSVNHDAARSFANWYMASLQNYHDWQITTVRKLYPGKLLMLYPSWGIRPGQLDAAIAVDLNGSTSAEINGEVSRGFDYARYVGGITDPNVVVYSTWLNADDSNDGSTNPAIWSPIHYLASLANSNPVQPKVFGENTGADTAADMTRSFNQMRKYNLLGIVWAFEPELYSGTYASITDYKNAIAQDKSLAQ
jgi:hypothetical protein